MSLLKVHTHGIRGWHLALLILGVGIINIAGILGIVWLVVTFLRYLGVLAPA
jgi:hypothetical protein